MDSKLTATFFKNNRQALRTKLANKFPIIIAGNGLIQRTGDSTLPFAQDSNFWYLTGVEASDVVLVMSETDEYLIVPNRSAVREAFDGANDDAFLTDRSGIATVLNEIDGWRVVAELTAVQNQASYLKPLSVYEPRHGFFANPARRRTAVKLRRLHTKLTLFDIRAELAALRSIKQPIEIERIEHAVRITKDTLMEVTSGSNFTAMQYEYELEAAITQGFRRRGASGHAYTPIVASGVHATTLHYTENNGPIGKNECIVVDVGAEVEHYAADITRTLMQGKPSARQQAIQDAVQHLQTQALTMLKPGTLLRDYEHEFERLMAAELLQLGLIRDVRDRTSLRRYYPHSTSHFLGLDVHDVGDYSQPLMPGMVITCEPGIYIPEEGIGVRIEDDVLITQDGPRVL